VTVNTEYISLALTTWVEDGWWGSQKEVWLVDSSCAVVGEAGAGRKRLANINAV